MRSLLSRIALMLVNIHFGGAVSGIAAMRYSQSMPCILGANRFASSAAPAMAAPMISAFFTPASS